MVNHMLEGLLPGILGKRDLNPDPPAENSGNAAQKIADDRARAHGDAPHDAEVLDNAIAGKVVCSRHEHGCLQIREGLRHLVQPAQPPVVVLTHPLYRYCSTKQGHKKGGDTQNSGSRRQEYQDE